MGQLGFMEIIVIFLVALLVFGPKKLPELGKSLGKGLREFRKATNDLKSSWEEQVREVEHSVDDVKHTVHQTTREINEDLNRDTNTGMPEPEPINEPSQDPAVAVNETTEKEEVKSDVHQN
jgi:sec-independent protein translocase protein TatA